MGNHLSAQNCQCNPKQNTDARIEAVFFAQTHVLEPSSPYFKLVGAREALIKVNITSPSNAPALPVCAFVELQGRETKLCLKGPARFPRHVPKDQHSFENSYTATIPSSWIWNGLKVTVQMGNQKKELNNINVGADTRGRMRYFDFLVFGDREPAQQLPEEFYQELAAKLPVTGLDKIDAGDFDLPVVSILAYKEQAARIAVRDTPDNWQGMTFSMTQLRELAKANGEYYTTIYVGAMSTAGGGWGGGNNFAGYINAGVFWHELGHAYSLLHNDANKDYPYKGDNVTQFDYHAGPTWAYDPIKKNFIPDTIQANAVGDLEHKGWYKHDPQWGGGAGDQEKGYFIRHYSDYNTWLMQKYMENNIDRKDPDTGKYERWNDAQKRWLISDRQSWNYPIKENIPVYTVWGTSSVTAEANFIYDPIQYNGNLVELFDPRKPEDIKAMAEKQYCYQCNLTVRIVQGGQEKFYAINNNFDMNAKEGDFFEMKGWAVNVPVSDGKIESVALYHTPDLINKGMPAHTPEPMAVWPDKRQFSVPMSLGNRVWHDQNRNGLQDLGEPGIPGVKLVLWRIEYENGKPKYKSFGGVKTTDENGYYYFTGLENNDYQVFVWEVDNFKEGGPLHGMTNSQGDAAPDQNPSNLDDNGLKGGGEVGGPWGSFITRPFRMNEGKQPLNDGDNKPNSDANSNWTIDFGFYFENGGRY